MASMWRKISVYLGLQDDDEGYGYEEYEGFAESEPREAPTARERREPRVQDHTGTVRPLPREESAPAAVTPAASRPAVIRTVAAPTMARVHVVEPRAFNDAQEVGDKLKANQPVILNLQGLSRDLQRRLIDFASGLAYAVGASMARVADQVFLLSPPGVEIAAEEKERLQARGLYDA
ncbi:MAG: cell division protein SepF [Acidimicrobiia bacterium]